MSQEPLRFDVLPPASGAVCDFCSSPKVYGAFQCEDFVAIREGGFELGSKGGWAACRECHDLIEEDKWRELLHRSVMIFANDCPVIPIEFAMPLIKKTHDLFRELMKKSS